MHVWLAISSLILCLVNHGHCQEGPCIEENIRAGRLYHPYPPNPAAYIQCSKWGQVYVRRCPPSLIWNQDKESCLRTSSQTGPLERQDCPAGQVYDTCGTACPQTCSNLDQGPTVCTTQCVDGCRCTSGLLTVKDGKGNITDCITRDKCPTTPQTNCPAGQVYDTCGTACPQTCSNLYQGPIPCTAQCVVGCRCSNGLITVKDGQGNITDCIARDKCPNTPQTNCPTGQVYDTCGTACPQTCSNLNQGPIACTKQCVIGCRCSNGLLTVKDGQGNITDCIARDKCSNTPQTNCPTGQVYDTCGTACPQTCSNLNQGPIACTKQCVIGCRCSNGLLTVKDGQRNITDCIARDKCPNTPQTNCPAGQVYDECGTACPRTCSNLDKNIICTEQCVSGCRCANDLITVRNNSGIITGCITRNQCQNTQVQCPATMKWYDCGSACNRTCDQPVVRCNKRCVPRCQCPPDTLLSYGIDGISTCISRAKCPSTTDSRCSGGRVWMTCAKTCIGSARNCGPNCVPRCQCPRNNPIWCSNRKQCIRRRCRNKNRPFRLWEP